MPQPVCHVDSEFEGFCQICGGMVRGKMITGEPDFDIEGKLICVTGSIGQGECGHFCVAEGLSEVLDINGKKVVRVGDPVSQGIDGVLVTGSDFVSAD